MAEQFDSIGFNSVQFNSILLSKRRKAQNQNHNQNFNRTNTENDNATSPLNIIRRKNPMAERIPRYFGGQCPPPPPPPPPPPAAGYGNTAAAPPYSTPGQQPYTFNYSYNYNRGYGLPTIPASVSTVGVQKHNAQANSNARKLTNHNDDKPDENPRIAERENAETTCRTIDTTKTTATKISWTCKACNITLDSEKALKGHRKSHVRCSDCSFEGSPKVVKAHYQAKHGKFSGSGFKTVTVGVPGCRVQKFKICVGNRPQDIQKWIEERKKKFPRYTAKAEAQNAETTKAPSSGLSSLLAGYGSSDDSDSDVGEKPANTSTTSVRKENTVATAPQAGNTSATETTPEIENEADCAESQGPKSSRPCRFFLRNGVCRNGDNCRFRHDTQSRSSALSNKSAKKRKRGGHTSSDTLLRKLLRNDMERESSLSMQLLKFIVQQNFFLEPTHRKDAS